MITEDHASLKTKFRQELRLAWLSVFPSGPDLVCYCLELQHREHFAEGQTNYSVLWYELHIWVYFDHGNSQQ